MTTWADVRQVVAQEVAHALGCHPTLVIWDEAPKPASEDLVILSVVSDVDEGESTGGTRVDTRAQIQIQAESTTKGPRAQDMAAQIRARLKLKSTQTRMAEQGVAVVMQPGPVRSANYEDDGFLVDTKIFELPIRFFSEQEDLELDTKPARRVEYTGGFDPDEEGEESLELEGAVDKPEE